MIFGHEKLRAYSPSIEFVALTAQIIENTPRGYSDLLDQLRRATISIPLNIAEGSGKNSDKDKKRFYAVARGSAMECSAILDVLFKLKLIDSNVLEDGRKLLDMIVGILTVICRQ